MKKTPRFIQNFLNVLPMIIFLGMISLLYIYLRPWIKETPPYVWIQQHIYYPSIKAIVNIFYHRKTFVIAFVVVLILEKIFPAKPKQKTISVGLAQDTVWLLLEAALQATVVVVYIKFLNSIYKTHFDFLTVQAIKELPAAWKFLIGVIVADFLSWFHHWVRHKVPWFWEFHTVHHSQKELNMFTDLRYHVLEYLISSSIYTFPFLIFGVDTYSVVTYAVFHTWFTHLYHANIKSNFGILRYVLVTPQSHRIHHSIEQKHRDHNFGVLFSVWDHIFGTQYRGYDEYPDTGIEDDHFPLEKSLKGLNLLLNPIRQHLYPFQAIVRSIFGKK